MNLPAVALAFVLRQAGEILRCALNDKKTKAPHLLEAS